MRRHAYRPRNLPGRSWSSAAGPASYAEQLFETRLPPHAIYVGRDISEVMVQLPRDRFARFGPRARVEKSDGGKVPMDGPDDAFDRFICTSASWTSSPTPTRMRS